MSQSKKIKCVVLDVDWEKQVIEVSTDVDLVQSVSKQLHDESHVGDSLSVNILLVKDKYLVASVASTGNFVLVMTSDYHKPYSQELEYQPGAILTATIIHTSATSGISLYSNLPITTLSDPIQKSLLPLTVSGEQSGGHLKIGKTLSFKIIDINATEMIVEPVRSDKSFEKTKTIVHVSNIPIRNLQLEELLTTQHHPFKEFSVGQTITCKVLHIRIVSPEENESNDSDLSQLAYLTVVASSENSSSDYLNFIQWKGRHSVKEGQIYPAVVTKTSEVNCVVSLSPYVSTHLQLMDVSTNTTLIKKFKKKVYVGLSLFVCVTKLETKGNSKFSLTVSRACIENHLTEGNTSIPPPIPSNSSIEIGTVLFGILDLEHSTKSSRPPALTVWLGQMLPPGRVCICEVDEYENWQDHSTSIWSQDEVNNDFIIAGRKHGDFVKCVVKDRFGDRIELSLRPSRLLKKATPMIVSTDEIPEVGSLVKGYVTNITPNGCFVRLSSELTAIVYLKDLDDGFIENFVELFPVGKLVQGRLLSCNSAEGTARLSLKQKDVTGTEIVSKEISVLNVGDIVTGVIERLTNFGVFVKLDGSSVVGLSRNDVSVDRNLNKLPEEIYNIGDIVKAKIINISKSLNKVALALASSFLLSKSDSTHEPASDLYEEHELKTTESVPNSAPVVVSRRNASLLVWNDFEDLQSVKKAKTEVNNS